MTIYRVRVCTCGHDESWHVDGGACSYGRGHAMGGCSCEGFSRRRRPSATATDVPPTPGSSGLLNAIDEVLVALAKLRGELVAAPRVIRRRPAEPVVRAAPPLRQPRVAGDAKLGRCERAILTVLAQHGARTKVQVAILSGYSHTSGGFRNAISALRTAGLVTGGGDALGITEAGRGSLGDVEPLPRGKALLEYWMTNAGGRCERRIIEELAAVYPRVVPKHELALRTGYQATSGGFRNSLSRLRTLQLIKGGADLALASTLAEAS